MNERFYFSDRKNKNSTNNIKYMLPGTKTLFFCTDLSIRLIKNKLKNIKWTYYHVLGQSIIKKVSTCRRKQENNCLEAS